MALYAKSSGADFEPAPSGLCNAVCVDVVDAGQKPDMNGVMKDKIRLVFQTDKKLSTGKLAIVSGQFTLSAHEKSNLRKFCESWRGKAYETTREFEMFDLEKLIGKSAALNVIHRSKDGKVFANIQAVMPPQKQMQQDGSYTRKKDRDNGYSQGGQSHPPAPARQSPSAPEPEYTQGDDSGDDDVPF